MSEHQHAGEVRVWHGETDPDRDLGKFGPDEVVEPYDADQLREIIRQGQTRPRLLTLEERRRARANKREARQAAVEFEAWARAHWGASLYTKRIPLQQEWVPET